MLLFEGYHGEFPWSVNRPQRRPPAAKKPQSAFSTSRIIVDDIWTLPTYFTTYSVTTSLTARPSELTIKSNLELNGTHVLKLHTFDF